MMRVGSPLNRNMGNSKPIHLIGLSLPITEDFFAGSILIDRLHNRQSHLNEVVALRVNQTLDGLIRQRDYLKFKIR